MKQSAEIKTLKNIYIAVFAVLCLVVFLGGYLFYLNRRDLLQQSKFDELSAIAELKLSQIQLWKNNLMAEGYVFSQNSLWANELQGFINKKNSGTYLRERIDLEKRIKDFSAISIFDTDLNCVLCDSQFIFRKDIFPADIFSKGEPVLSSIIPNDDTTDFYINLYIPVKLNSRPVALMVLQQDPGTFIFPLIKSWPTPSRSSETLLFEVHGDYLIYLNTLRHSEKKPFTFRFPVNEPDLPAAILARGKTGIVEGKDYRGVEVLADLRKVPGTSWFLVTKIDQEETFAALIGQSRAILIFTLIILSSIGFLLLYLWKDKSARMFRKMYDSEAEKTRGAEKALKEKEFLVKEIHHRVKNNLQVVSGMLSLQTQYLNDVELRNIFIDSANRINTFATIHQKLYAHNVDQISTAEFIPELAGLIQKTHNSQNKIINIDIQIEPVELNVERAVPVGLIINEVVSNSYKHAFNGTDNGTIYIKLNRGSNSEIILTVGDNGKGMTQETGGKGLGALLIEALSDQLDAEYDINTKLGTEYTFTFHV